MQVNGLSPLRHAVGILTMLGLAAPLFASTSDTVLEEIVVTATKRTESLQDVPISIGVVTGETIEQYGIFNLQDLQSFVPNLTVQRTFGNWAVRIRGLGSGVTNLAFDSSVSIFSDGIYCGRSRCLETAYLDPGRVEVARGPQGALFGKSTIAGALGVFSARPTDTFESFVKGGYEFENGGYTTSAMVSGPIADNVRGRLAGEYRDVDGWMSNPYGHDDAPSTKAYAVRGSIEWDINEDSMLYLKAETFSTDMDGRSNQLVSPGLFGGLTADPNPEYDRDSTRRVSTGTSKDEFDNSDSFGFTAQFDTMLGEHSLAVIAGYWDLDYDNYLDVDGVPENFLNTTLSEDYDQQSLEVRLLSPVGNRFEYIAGVLYHTSDTKTRQHSPFGFFPAFLAPVPVGGDRNFKRDSDTWSVYAQTTWHITDQWRVIVDARYTDEKQKAEGHSFPVSYPDLINPVYTPAAFNQPPEYLFKETYNDDSFDPSIRIQYDWTDSLMVYAAISTGSKPGGLKANDGNLGTQLLAKNDTAYYQRYVGQPTVTTADLLAGVTLDQGNGVFDFKGEDATNYELGLKALFADGRASLNAAVFTMQFDDLQTSSYDGTQFIIQNAASADVTGFELEGMFLATPDVQLHGSLGYVDATYDEFMGAQCIVADVSGAFEDPTCVNGFEDLSGKRLERSPKWEVNLGVDWQKQINNDFILSSSLSMYYSGNYYVRQDFHPYGEQDDFTKWDARIALATPDDTWEVALIGRNLTDKRIIQHAYEVAGSNFVAEGVGRTLTLQAQYRFH
ncbi:MAG: TonB-dependent receptor [Pseudomonadales bacterium]|nr:TonB-dependent receptor [Pseudomonadales bacterium]